MLAADSLRGWEDEAGWRVRDVSIAHSFFLPLVIFSSSGCYRLELFEAQVMCVVGVLMILIHINHLYDFYCILKESVGPL